MTHNVMKKLLKLLTWFALQSIFRLISSFGLLNGGNNCAAAFLW